jgi:hypothetical protein
MGSSAESRHGLVGGEPPWARRRRAAKGLTAATVPPPSGLVGSSLVRPCPTEDPPAEPGEAAVPY